MKYFFTLIILSLGLSVHSQQLGQYTMYMLNKYRHNSAYAGLDNSLSATGVFRSQWVGLEGSPTMQNINAHMPLYIAKGGIGLNVENITLGAQQNLSAKLSYAYHREVGSVGILSFGGGAGVYQKSLDGTKLRTPDGIYNPDQPPINHNDQILSEIQETGITPIFDIGVFYQGEKLEIGASAVNLVESKINLNTNVNFLLKRHYFMTMAYNWELNDVLTLQPSIMAKSDLSETQ